ncbi:MAG: M20 family metallopeptidase [Bacteroidia bacterium]
MLNDQIRKLAAELNKEVVKHRRHLHANPELSFEEVQTAAYVQEQLRLLGIPFNSGIAGHGVVGMISGKNPNKRVVALRADMDALPIVEANEVPYKSQREGVMHACGHDAHTASLLGTAAILKQLEPQLEGSIKLIFQPAEERLPGGASLMIKAGVLQNPKPASIIGQHVMPLIPAGKVGFRSGMYMASADEITMVVRGKGGHAAMPHMNTDTVMITAQILVALQQLVSRYANPTIPSVLSFGKITAEGAFNIIPNEVVVLGTFRTMDEKWRKEAHLRMQQIAVEMAKAMGGSCDFQINVGYPFLVNNPEVTARARRAAEAYLGADRVVDLDLWMAAEDFAYYSQVADACFYRLGTRNEAAGITSSVHTPSFDIDETALEIGCGLMAAIAVHELQQPD